MKSIFSFQACDFIHKYQKNKLEGGFLYRPDKGSPLKEVSWVPGPSLNYVH